jgi:hypothetical protein
MDLTLNQRLKLVLVVWVVAWPLVACGPAFLAGGDLLGFVLGGFTGLVFGSVLFVPWLVGVGVLYLLVRLTDVPPSPRA